MTSREHDDPRKRDDPPRDARLLAALHHAPDRDAVPPPEVTARILAAARAAVRPAPPAPWALRLAAWLKAPQLGAAFGTIAVAVLVGVMWSTRELPESPAAADAAGHATGAPAPQEATPAETGAAARSAEAVQDALRSNQESTTPALPRVDSAPAGLAKAKPDAAMPSRPRAAASPPPRADAEAFARRIDAMPTAPAPASPPPTDAPVSPPREVDAARPVAAPEADGARKARQEAAAMAAAPTARDRADEAKTLLEQRAAAGAAAAPSTAATGRLAAKTERSPANALSSIDAPPLEALDARLGGAAADVAWQAGDKAFAHGAPQRAWWASVRTATAGRWQADASQRVASLPVWVGLSLGGRLAATLSIDGDALLLTEGGRAWKAPVGAAMLRAWQDELSRW